MSETPSAQLIVQIESADATPGELDALARQLQTEIGDLNVEAVGPAKGGALPEDAKAGEALITGALAVNLLPALLPPLGELLAGWAARVRPRHQTLKLKFTSGDQSLDLEYDPATTDVQQLVAALTARFTPAAGAGGLALNSGADTNIGGDAVGRDKNVTNVINAQPGATIIVNPPQ
jgi:hypothetical protein